MSDIQSAGRRALITGGASGFGLGIAEALLARGGQVAIGDVDAARLQDAERGLDSDNLLSIELDVTSAKSAAAAVAACEERFGGLDTLVNSAGVIAFNRLAEISEAEWDRVIDVDLKGTFLCCQAAAALCCAPAAAAASSTLVRTRPRWDSRCWPITVRPSSGSWV